MPLDHTLTWEVARVGGVLAYVLVTASVAIGILLSLKVRSEAWPRFVTNELHRYLSLLSLVFTVVHGVAVWLDPFTAFTPSEVLVPGVAHYRPLWMALGIVSGYLAAALYATEWLRGRIGYAWWRRLHYLTFAAWLAATLHGLGNGTDTAAPWALALYALSVALVVGLLGARLVTALGPIGRRRALALLGGGTLALAIFVAVGPARAGWNTFANNGNGSGASTAWLTAHPATASTAASELPALPAEAQFLASLVQPGVVSGRFSGDASGTVQVDLGSAAAPPSVQLDFASGTSCSGPLQEGEGRSLVASCRTPDGTVLRVALFELRTDGRSLAGELRVAAGNNLSGFGDDEQHEGSDGGGEGTEAPRT